MSWRLCRGIFPGESRGRVVHSATGDAPAALLPTLLFSLALAACDTPRVTLVDPDVGTTADPDRVAVQLEDSTLAAALGWSQGVPGAMVQLHRVIDPFRPDTLYTDSAGFAYLPDLLSGHYRIAALRIVPEDESGPVGGVVRAFGGGLKRDLPANIVELTLGIDQSASLVISELFYGGGTQEIRYNLWAQFFELYNNSDATVYLDGMLFGFAYGYVGSQDPCSESRGFREDPRGLWTREFHQFPGGGSDYPVAPGQTVTVARDAVDHSVVHPTLPDLSQADFELEGTADTDNPDVPNMPSVGQRSDLTGHGMVIIATMVKFLALPVDVASLETAEKSGFRYDLIPADRIVDVQHGYRVSPNSAPSIIYAYDCTWVNREFDRVEAVFYRLGDNQNDNTTSLHRRVLRYTPGGRAVLQDVNTSFVDFVLGKYSPGRIEY